MDFFIKLDSLQYRNSVARLIKEKRADAKLLLQEEARLLVKGLVGITPPHTEDEGRKAIDRNLRRAFSPLDPQNFSSDGTPAGKRIAVLIRNNDIVGLNALFARMKRGKLAGKTVLMPDQLPGIHRRLMNSRGRVSKSNFLTTLSTFRRYRDAIWKRVGWAKAGWLAAAQAVGLSLPGYVTRHSSRLGTAAWSPAPKLGITLMNFSTKVPNMAAKVDFAVHARYNSLVREAQRILSGGKSRRGSFAGTETGSAGP